MTATPIARPPIPKPLSNARPADEVPAPKNGDQPKPAGDSAGCAKCGASCRCGDGFDMPAGAKFAPKRGIQHTDGRLSAKATWDQLPKDLSAKVDQQTWRDLPEKQRNSLIETYSRFKEIPGAWDLVKKVIGEKNATEPNAKIGPAEFEVAGNSGGIQFEATDGEALRKKLQGTGYYGVDGGKVGALHPGQYSMREWTEAPGTSLHVSIDKKGNRFDTHVDKVSPVNKPVNGNTKIDPRRGPSHHANEVWPEMIRDKTGIPGVKVDVTVKPGSRDQKPEAVATVGVELKIPVSKKKQPLPKQPRTEGAPVPEAVMQRVMKRVEQSGVKFPVPKGVTDRPDRAAIAEAMAAKIMEAAAKGESTIDMDFVDYAHQAGYQKPMTEELKRLAHHVREEMIAARNALPPDQRKQMPDISRVNQLQVTYGVKGQGQRVQMDQWSRHR